MHGNSDKPVYSTVLTEYSFIILMLLANNI